MPKGTLAPETWAAAHERFEAFGPTAQSVVREVAKAMEFDREEYDDRVKLEVRATNEVARSLYREFGFETHHVVPAYYDDGEDAHVMVRGR